MAVPLASPTAPAALPVAPRQVHAPGVDAGPSLFWNGLLQVARKEVLQLLRTKRLIVIGGLFVAVLLLLTIVLPLTIPELFDQLQRFMGLGSGAIAAENLSIYLFLYGFLFLSGYFFITLMPIVLTADAVCSEWSSRTIFLLLSKPVSRTAFVLGKFAGTAGTVVATVWILLFIDYLVLMPLHGGDPSSEDIAGFFGALGIIGLGILAWSSVALFFSTITRSTAVSMILAIASWIIILPLLGNADLIVALVRFGGEAFTMSPSEAGVGWSQYLNPGALMGTASSLLVPRDLPDGGIGSPFDVAPDPWAAALGLALQTVVFVGLSVLVVRRRNFE